MDDATALPPSRPTDTETDARWMLRALELARSTVGLASPNPMVGCVIVRDGSVLGDGAHRYADYDHAEIVALKRARAAGHDVAGATAYVTLEPCSHHGRTGPCADALIEARVARVVAATSDPNPKVSGQGIERLQRADIEVNVGVCEHEARTLNDGFACWVRTGQPFVTLKAAISADGMLAPAPASRIPGETFWITGTEARAEIQQMRHAADAVLTGIGTVFADDPLLTDRSGGERRRRLLRVVLDSRLRISMQTRLIQSAHDDLLIFCAEDAPVESAERLQAEGLDVERVSSTEGRLDLSAVLRSLGARGILNLLLECGAQLNGAFLTGRLVHRAVIYQSERNLGTGSIPFAIGVDGPQTLESRLTSVDVCHVGADRRVRGYLRDPWSTLLG